MDLRGVLFLMRSLTGLLAQDLQPIKTLSFHFLRVRVTSRRHIT
jgi:hypothetical protein